jgi:excisionase family DNA binding protein
MARLMTVDEVADYLRVTEKTIYRLLERGKIPATKVGRQWRFDTTYIDKWLRRNSAKTKASILVVDDEEIVRLLLKESLEELGHQVTTAENAAIALEIVRKMDLDLAFLDLKMPGMDGAELFRQIKAVKPGLAVVIITGYPDSEMMARALAQGPFGVMNKPFGESDIITAVHNFLHISRR